VKELMGHKSMSMTERYAHLSPGVRQEAVKMLDTAETKKAEVAEGA
jgi:integrase